jgi:hypothetical protein
MHTDFDVTTVLLKVNQDWSIFWREKRGKQSPISLLVFESLESPERDMTCRIMKARHENASKENKWNNR